MSLLACISVMDIALFMNFMENINSTQLLVNVKFLLNIWNYHANRVVFQYLWCLHIDHMMYSCLDLAPSYLWSPKVSSSHNPLWQLLMTVQYSYQKLLLKLQIKRVRRFQYLRNWTASLTKFRKLFRPWEYPVYPFTIMIRFRNCTLKFRNAKMTQFWEMKFTVWEIL